MAKNVLLVGRTGNGKSSTGNSILGSKSFQPRLPGQEIVVDIKAGTAEIGNQTITVVDGSGIGDAGLNDNDEVKKTVEYVETALGLSPNGFNAVVLVLKFGERFTNQQNESVRLIKGILGNKVMETHGVIVMTYGDNFGLDEDEGDLTFEDWCKQQDGLMLEMFQECQYRCLLFNNRAKDEETIMDQRVKLLSVVEVLASKVKPYTRGDYDAAKDDRNRLLVTSYIPTLETENKKVLDGLVNEIRQIDETGESDRLSVIPGLEDRLNSHKVWLEKKTAGVGIPGSVQLELDIANTALQNKKRILNMKQEIREQEKRIRKKKKKEKDDGYTDRSEYRSQPSRRDDNNTERSEYRSQQTRQDDNNTERSEYRSQPTRRDDNNTERSEYRSQPTRRDDNNTERSEYRSQPTRRDDNNTERSEYRSQPTRRDDNKTERSEYRSQPTRRDDNNTERSEYRSQPTRKDDGSTDKKGSSSESFETGRLDKGKKVVKRKDKKPGLLKKLKNGVVCKGPKEAD